MASLLGAKLRYLRRQAHLTQADLTQQLGLASQAYLSNLESGRKTPSLVVLLRVAHRFSVTLDYLVLDTLPVDQPVVYVGPTTKVPPDTATFGHKLRYLRDCRALTQQQLAAILHLQSQSFISHLETERYEPSLELLQQIAALFEVSIDDLVRNTHSVNFDGP